MNIEKVPGDQRAPQPSDPNHRLLIETPLAPVDWCTLRQAAEFANREPDKVEDHKEHEVSDKARGKI